MLKALMVITMVSGATYEVKLPSMEQCMKERTPVEVRADVESTVCIPRTEDKVPSELISQFMDMFMMLSEQQWHEDCQDYHPPKP